MIYTVIIGSLCAVLILFALVCFGYVVFPLAEELANYFKGRPLVQAAVHMCLGIFFLCASDIIFYLFRYLF